jgi:hypothetical protein
MAILFPNLFGGGAWTPTTDRLRPDAATTYLPQEDRRAGR